MSDQEKLGPYAPSEQAPTAQPIAELMGSIGKTLSFRDAPDAGDVERERLAMRDERIRRTIPRGYVGVSVHGPEIVQRVQGWESVRARIATVSLARTNLVIRGPAGTGKSSLLAALVRSQIEADRFGVRWIAACDLESARDHHHLGDEAALERMACCCRILALDDLGNARRAASAVDRALLKRYDDESVTWITTAFSAKSLEEKYGAGIARRVFEGALVVELRAPVVALGCADERSGGQRRVST